MNGHLIVYPPGGKKDIFRGQMAYVDDAYHNMDDLKKLDLLNDDGSFPPLLLSLVNYLPVRSPGYCRKMLAASRCRSRVLWS